MAGSGRGVSGAVLKMLGAKDHTMEVVSAEDLTSHMRRLWFRAPTMLEELDWGPGAFVRMWFPDPKGRRTQYQRGYTIAEIGESPDICAVDMLLHEPSGPASQWAAAAVPGAQLQAMIYGSRTAVCPDPAPPGYLLIGDAAALPAIASILRTFPSDLPVEVLLEEHDPADREIPLPEHPGASITWVPRTGPRSLAEALPERDRRGWHAWMTPESSSLSAIRRRLKNDPQAPQRREMHMQAYWVQGREMGVRRDSA